MVGEAYVYVQAARLKAYATFLIRGLSTPRSPVYSREKHMPINSTGISALSLISFLLIAAFAVAFFVLGLAVNHVMSCWL